MAVQVAAAFAGLPAAVAGPADHDRVVVAWNAGGTGQVAAFDAAAPWNFETPVVEVGAGSILRAGAGRIYTLSRTAGTLTVIDPGPFEVTAVHALAAPGEPRDVAVAAPDRVYVTRMAETHLLRLDPETGETAEVVDLGIFADDDGVPDMNMTAVLGDLLFVQVQRRNVGHPSVYVPPAMLAVVDLNTETLVDVDGATPGVQAIELEGTAPKFKMEVRPQTGELVVGATGISFDDGGLELVDPAALQSEGLIIAESASQTGADLGAFVMTAPDAGFLVFTTDFALSSHFLAFTVPGGVQEPQLYDVLGYFAPALVHHPAGGTVFFPDGNGLDPGVHVFDAVSGERLTDDVIPTGGPPTDLLLEPAPPCPADLDGDGLVGTADLLTLLAAWGPNAGHRADLDGSGAVGTPDFLLLLASWGPCT